MPKRGQALNHKQRDLNLFIAPVCKKVRVEICTHTALPAVMFYHRLANRFQYCVLMEAIFSYANAKRKPKMNMNLKFHTFIGRFSSDIMAVKGLMVPVLRFPSIGPDC